MTVAFAGLLLFPWLPNGRRSDGLVAQSPASGDWSCHRAVTIAVLETGIPPRNPFLCHKPLTYYYGHFLEAAALSRMSGGTLGVDGALLALTLLLAAATCVLIFHITALLTSAPSVALVATAVTLFVSGMDIAVLYGLKALAGVTLWDWGHLQVWTSHPRVPVPFSNLHWAPHHHAAALLGVVLAWHIARRESRPGWPQILAAGVLVAGVIVNSAYLGMVVLDAIALMMLREGWLWVRKRGRAAALLGHAVCAGLGLALASGMMSQMARMVPGQQRFLAPGPPVIVGDHKQVQQVLSMRRPWGYTGCPRWLAAAANIVAGTVGVVLQFGLVGWLAWYGMWAGKRSPQLRGCLGQPGMEEQPRDCGSCGPPLPWAWVAFVLSAATCTFFLRNFDLQMRSAGLLWLLLTVYVARYLCIVRLDQLHWWRASLFALLSATGLAGLGFEVAGMSRPVFFDASDMAVMSWVRTHTPPGSVVQAYPGTGPRPVRIPRPRYFVWPSFPEFTGRCAVMGDRLHVRLYSTPEERRRLHEALAKAFHAGSAEEARRRFAALGIHYVLWTSADDSSSHADARRNLLDSQCFELACKEGPSFVVRVRKDDESAK